MKAVGSGLSETGTVRTSNEDFVLCQPEIGLYIVCDGIGGHVGGDVASRMAAETVAKYLNENLSGLGADPSAEDVFKLLQQASANASSAIYEIGSRRAGSQGMGTTIAVVLLVGNRAHVAHVGDTRVYFYRHGTLHRVTKDHTLTTDMVSAGLIREDQVDTHHLRHMLSRAVGPYESVLADTVSIEVVPGDRFMICTDGVYDVLEERELGGFLQDPSVADIPAKLVKASLASGSEDNSSAVVIQIEKDETRSDSRPRGSEFALLKLEVLENVYLFSQLDLPELAKVVERCTVKSLKAGEYLMREHDLGKEMYMVLDGELNVMHNNVLLANLKKGDHVGEMALVTGHPRSASVQATKDCTLLCMSDAQLAQILRYEPELGVKLLFSLSQGLSQRLDRANAKVS